MFLSQGPGKFNVLTFEENGKKVYDVSFGDEKNMPSCTCEDWRASFYPCKHLFAIMQKFPDDWAWENLPQMYRCSPFLTLDFGGDHSSPTNDPKIQKVCGTSLAQDVDMSLDNQSSDSGLCNLFLNFNLDMIQMLLIMYIALLPPAPVLLYICLKLFF